MSLLLTKYKFQDVTDWDDLLVECLDGSKELNLATLTVINYLAVIGISKLTTENAIDAWIRISICETFNGALVNQKIDKNAYRKYFVTQADVTRVIGIETEATSKTFIEFWETFGQGRSKTVSTDETSAFIANGQKTLLEICRKAC